MTMSTSPVQQQQQQQQLKRLAWTEAMLDTSIVAYESHRNALQNIYAQLVKWQQPPGKGCIHINSAEVKELLKDISDVLEQCTLRLQPMEDATPAAPPSAAPPKRSLGDTHPPLDTFSDASNRGNMSVSAPSQLTDAQPAALPPQEQQHRRQQQTASHLQSARPATTHESEAPPQRAQQIVKAVESVPLMSLTVAGPTKAQPRSLSQPGHRTGVALTPWPIIVNGQGTGGGAATSLTARSRSGSTPPSAQLRAEENYRELPAAQYRSYKMTGERLLPSPERRAAAAALERRTEAQQDAKESDTYQQLFGAGSRSGESSSVNAERRGPSTHSVVTSTSQRSQPTQHEQMVQRRQGYLSEDQSTPRCRGSPATVENSSSRSRSTENSGRVGVLGNNRKAGDTPASVKRYPGAVTAAAAAVAATATNLPDSHAKSTSDSHTSSLVPCFHSGTVRGEATQRIGEPRAGGSIGLVYTPSAMSQRANSETSLPLQSPAEHRRLRTSTPRRVTSMKQDSKQVQDAVYNRRTRSTARPPVRADAPETLLFMEKEDAILEKRKERELRELRELHHDPHQHIDTEAHAALTTIDGTGGRLIANKGKVEPPVLTAVEEQLIAEQAILSTQLEKMQMEMSLSISHHRERGHEQRYVQLKTRMARVEKDLNRVKSELKAVRGIDRESHSRSNANGA
ncbi:hypothetical protein JKF63_07401 [Porcisia hertigi]|uniref:Uncharacterized protein n=1 Tax=Porcisia hertigi TaxID=2761500 RepID=A0A836LKV1_9TRYP|nr:hypothetical protein JKF63_07401 [Porcisia hertigi]